MIMAAARPTGALALDALLPLQQADFEDCRGDGGPAGDHSPA